jgi:GNAT superfamily N-acetyltransferase
VFIRNAATPEDWSRARAICVATGAAGRPITATRAPFFGEFWVGPYQKLLPQWTYVAEEQGRIVGYLTGCPDTRAFERKRRWLFALPLFAKTVLRAYPPTGDTRRFLRRALGVEPEPNALFSRELKARLLHEYPAHLHVNLEDSSVRGRGAGRILMERFFGDLRRAGVTGVHVHCGEGPVPFYLKLGFEELERVEFKPGVWIFVMGKKF